MLIEKMTNDECLMFVRQMKFGRVACVREKQPYVVPIYFMPDDQYLYGFSAPGRKIDWMRANPLVCVEVDDVIDHSHWKTVVINGKYEELSDAAEHIGIREYALELLQRRAMWWQPASVKTQASAAAPIFFRIRIDEISGHRARPDTVEEGAFRPDIESRSHPRIIERVRRILG